LSPGKTPSRLKPLHHGRAAYVVAKGVQLEAINGWFKENSLKLVP
jgi:hypothetical protein